MKHRFASMLLVLCCTPLLHASGKYSGILPLKEDELVKLYRLDDKGQEAFFTGTYKGPANDSEAVILIGDSWERIEKTTLYKIYNEYPRSAETNNYELKTGKSFRMSGVNAFLTVLSIAVQVEPNRIPKGKIKSAFSLIRQKIKKRKNKGYEGLSDSDQTMDKNEYKTRKVLIQWIDSRVPDEPIKKWSNPKACVFY